MPIWKHAQTWGHDKPFDRFWQAMNHNTQGCSRCVKLLAEIYPGGFRCQAKWLRWRKLGTASLEAQSPVAAKLRWTVINSLVICSTRPFEHGHMVFWRKMMLIFAESWINFSMKCFSWWPRCRNLTVASHHDSYSPLEACPKVGGASCLAPEARLA